MYRSVVGACCDDLRLFGALYLLFGLLYFGDLYFGELDFAALYLGALDFGAWLLECDDTLWTFCLGGFVVVAADIAATKLANKMKVFRTKVYSTR